MHHQQNGVIEKACCAPPNEWLGTMDLGENNLWLRKKITALWTGGKKV